MEIELNKFIQKTHKVILTRRYQFIIQLPIKEINLIPMQRIKHRLFILFPISHNKIIHIKKQQTLINSLQINASNFIKSQ